MANKLDAWHAYFRRQSFNNQAGELGLLWLSFHFSSQAVSCRIAIIKNQKSFKSTAKNEGSKRLKLECNTARHEIYLFLGKRR